MSLNLSVEERLKEIRAKYAPKSEAHRPAEMSRHEQLLLAQKAAAARSVSSFSQKREKENGRPEPGAGRQKGTSQNKIEEALKIKGQINDILKYRLGRQNNEPAKELQKSRERCSRIDQIAKRINKYSQNVMPGSTGHAKHQSMQSSPCKGVNDFRNIELIKQSIKADLIALKNNDQPLRERPSLNEDRLSGMDQRLSQLRQQGRRSDIQSSESNIEKRLENLRKQREQLERAKDKEGVSEFRVRDKGPESGDSSFRAYYPEESSSPHKERQSLKSLTALEKKMEERKRPTQYRRETGHQLMVESSLRQLQQDPSLRQLDLGQRQGNVHVNLRQMQNESSLRQLHCEQSQKYLEPNTSWQVDPRDNWQMESRQTQARQMESRMTEGRHLENRSFEARQAERYDARQAERMAEARQMQKRQVQRQSYRQVESGLRMERQQDPRQIDYKQLQYIQESDEGVMGMQQQIRTSQFLKKECKIGRSDGLSPSKADRSRSVMASMREEGWQNDIKRIEDKIRLIKEEKARISDMQKKERASRDSRKELKKSTYSDNSLKKESEEKTRLEALMQAFQNQILLDQALRENKGNFKENEKNFAELRAVLRDRGVNLTVEEVKSKFSLVPEEANPFQEERTIRAAELVQSYLEATRHWEAKVVGKFQRGTVEAFCDRLFGKLGVASMEDLVRVVNWEMRSLFKKRDLVLLFRRLGTMSREGIAGVLSRRQ